jgi:Protein of unknown function (DUF3467)
MSEEDFAEEMEEQKIDVSKKSESPQFTQFYANFAECGFTPWDIRILFCQTGETGLTKMATVIMAPPMVKALANLLNVNIKNYEADNGEIKMPESLVRQRDEMMKAREAAAKAKEAEKKE